MASPVGGGAEARRGGNNRPNLPLIAYSSQQFRESGPIQSWNWVNICSPIWEKSEIRPQERSAFPSPHSPPLPFSPLHSTPPLPLRRVERGGRGDARWRPLDSKRLLFFRFWSEKFRNSHLQEFDSILALLFSRNTTSFLEIDRQLLLTEILQGTTWINCDLYL